MADAATGILSAKRHAAMRCDAANEVRHANRVRINPSLLDSMRSFREPLVRKKVSPHKSLHAANKGIQATLSDYICKKSCSPDYDDS